jgi:hypothetical protein
MTSEGLLPCSQTSTTWHYPQPDQSKLSQPSSLRSILILPFHLSLGLLSGLPPLDFLNETLSGSLLPHMAHMTINLPPCLLACLGPLSFLLVPRTQLQQQRHNLQNVPDIQEQSLKNLHMIPKCQFQWSSHQCQKYGIQCINSERHYFVWGTQRSLTIIFC